MKDEEIVGHNVRVEAKLVGSVIENGRMNRTSHDARAQNDAAIFSGLAILENSNALIASHSSATRD